MKYLICACCGAGFRGWQHEYRDEGFGICQDQYCSTAYGYTTAGKKPDNYSYDRPRLQAEIPREKS